MNKLKNLSRDNRLPLLCETYHAQRKRQSDLEREARDAKQLADEAREEILAKLGEAKAGRCAGWEMTVQYVAGSPGKVVTKEMVGTVIGARSGYQRLEVERTAA